MQSIRWLAVFLTAGFCLIYGCGRATIAPSLLRYTVPAAVYVKGVAITPDNPVSSGGAVTAYTVNPALPAGLSLSVSSGIISGTPKAVSTAAAYTVTASNKSGGAIATLTITVHDRPPSGLTYSKPTAVYAVRVPIPPNSPSSTGGAVTSYAVSPALSPGLILNTATGIINGTPAIVTAAVNYTVTATNAAGSTAANLVLSAAKAVPTEPAMLCSDVAQLNLPNTQILEAELVPANTTNSTSYPRAGFLPEHCLVHGTIGARTGVTAPAMDQYGNLIAPALPAADKYGINFELRMPTTTWNGDFFFTGGSGNDGLVAEAVGATLGGGTVLTPALYHGFAVVTQNSGHTAGADQFGPSPDQNDGFGYDPQARYDYGYQQTGTLTPIVKSILTSFYGIGPVYSYFIGCSNGGREAMIASQRWGGMFDGIVAGDPGYRLPHAAIAEAWDTQQFAQAALAVGSGKDANGNPLPAVDANGNTILNPAASASDLALVGALVLAACDTLDQAKDGMIFNTDACRKAFDPSSLTQLQCQGAKTPACLLPAQITAIRNVFAGPVDSSGNALYSAWPYDVGISDPKWMMWPIGLQAPFPAYIAANITQGAQSAMYLFSTPPNPSLNIFTVLMDDINRAVMATDATFTQSAVAYMEATSTNLDAFTSHGGKIMFYHGESDPVFSMYDSVSYYQNLSSKYGATTGSFARLFLIPGMNHCSGGSHALDSIDPLTSIAQWVEEGAPPDSMLAQNSWTPVSGMALHKGSSRPLCPYPQFAQYTGTGDMDSAESYTCTVSTASQAAAHKKTPAAIVTKSTSSQPSSPPRRPPLRQEN